MPTFVCLHRKPSLLASLLSKLFKIFKKIHPAPALGPSLPLPIVQKLNEDLQYDPLVQPALLRHEILPSPQSTTTIAAARFAAARILAGQDDRVIVVVGPCSIHSPEQAIEYAHLLRSKLSTWTSLHIVMRAYL